MGSASRTPESSSIPSSASGIPPSMRGVRHDLSSWFRNLFSQGSTALSTPQGILGPLYTNLFGQNGSEDFLGARSALQRSLSGSGLGENVQTAYNQLLPGTQRSITEGSNALSTAAGPQGLRFSTDLMGQQGLLASRSMNDLNARSLTAGLSQGQTEAQTALGTYGLIGQLAQAQNPLLLALNYATQFPGIGNISRSGAPSANFKGNLLGTLTGVGSQAGSAGFTG